MVGWCRRGRGRREDEEKGKKREMLDLSEEEEKGRRGISMWREKEDMVNQFGERCLDGWCLGWVKYQCWLE